MITIFTIQKPNSGFQGIQQQALYSWECLKGDKEILLMNEGVKKNQYGTPLLNDAFRIASETAKYDVLLYTNADIVLTSDVFPVVSAIQDAFSSFLIVGQRTDVHNVRIDFKLEDWEFRLRSITSIRGKLHSVCGIDYFILPKSMIQTLNMPPFAVGRPAWDNWMIGKCVELSCPVINATGSILAVHQNHDYSHLKGGLSEMRRGLEAMENLRLAGDCAKTIKDADYLAKDFL